MRVRILVLGILVCGWFVLCAVPAVFAQDLRTGVEQVSEQIAKTVPEGKPLRIAVADFPDLQNVISDLGRYVANRLTTRFAQNPKFFVVERQRLGQVLAELKFSMSDLVDPAKAKQLGQMAGVEAIVVGTMSDLGNQVDIDARMIEIETNRMLSSATVTISKDQVVGQMLERGREATTPSLSANAPAPAISSSTRPTTSSGPARYQELPQLRVEVDGLQTATNGEVTVFVTYINKTRQEYVIGLDHPRRDHESHPPGKTFVLDNEGNRYEYMQGSGLSGGLDFTKRWRGDTSFLVLAPEGRATASFFFRRDKRKDKEETEKPVHLFHFSSEQVFVKSAQDIQKATPEKTFNISIRNIEPR